MTMLPDTYRDQIRHLVDAVDDPTVTDVVFAVSTRTASRRPRRTLVAVSVAVAVLGVFGLALVLRDNGAARRASVHPAVRPTVPASCVVGVDGNGGCTMRPAKASRYLGFSARVPNGVPQGWVVARKQLRVYRDPLPPAEAPLPPDVESVALYNQIWTPPGTDLAATGTCPTRLQVRERRAFVGEENVAGVQPVDLGDGRVVYGEFAQPSDCAGTPQIYTSVFWARDGISFNVLAAGLGREDIVKIVESLYDS